MAGVWFWRNGLGEVGHNPSGEGTPHATVHTSATHLACCDSSVYMSPDVVITSQIDLNLLPVTGTHNIHC